MKNNILIIFVAILLTSCASQRNVTYLKDIKGDFTMNITQPQYAPIQNGDWLSIVVNSKDAELSRMFNLPIVSVSMVSDGMYNTGNRIAGYQVNNDGNIDFPQLGQIKVSGLTLVELSDTIKELILKSGYIKDPIVTSQFMNFKISVMGEVARPGIYSVGNGRVNIFEALGMAGDMTIYGKRDNLKVIREENGVRNVKVLDLRNKEIFNSPYFYLHQNDIVYVEPNKVKAGQSEINQNRSVGTFASITSVLISLSVLIFK